MLVDNERLQYTSADESKCYSSIQALFKEQKINYSSILQDKQALTHILKLAADKLHSIRAINPEAAGLVVASSVAHARQIQTVLSEQLKQSSVLVSYHDPNAQSIIEKFKYDNSPWVISIGMISEGTDIPRLQVCCHLSNIRTELYFRQVLGRILRITASDNQEAWFFTFAEESLVKFSEDIELDIPDSCLYVKPREFSEDEPSSAPRTFEISYSGTSTTPGGVTWADVSSDLAGEERYASCSSVTLGHFRERVIEAFSAI